MTRLSFAVAPAATVLVSRRMAGGVTTLIQVRNVNGPDFATLGVSNTKS